MIKFTADTTKIALSSTRRAYKTEGFITLTRRIVAIDAFISRVAEGIFAANFVLPDGSSICLYTPKTRPAASGVVVAVVGV